MRLDFNSFVISGPSTVSLSIAKMLNGVLNAPTGKAVSQKSTCATDSFSVSNSPNIPNLCGTLSGEHGNYLPNYTCMNQEYFDINFAFSN